MTRSHDDIVESQFGPQAAAYISSAVHASGADLDWIGTIVSAARPAQALDLGTGGGHVAYRLAAHSRAVTACDLSEDMVTAVVAEARRRGFANIAGRVAPAEALPFEEGVFDLIACRFSAHHWRDFDAGLREARRVLARGGTALFVDVIAPGQVRADVHLQAVELLRDTSHVRDYQPSEWLKSLERAGFSVRSFETFKLRMDFRSWTDRMRTPDSHIAAIRSLQQRLPQEISEYFAIEADGSFTVDVMMIEAG